MSKTEINISQLKPVNSNKIHGVIFDKTYLDNFVFDHKPIYVHPVTNADMIIAETFKKKLKK